jgi:hypothetical protein
MKLRPLIFALLLMAMAFSLARALLSRDHVGGFEYLVGAALLAVMVLGVLRFSRQATGRA